MNHLVQFSPSLAQNWGSILLGTSSRCCPSLSPCSGVEGQRRTRRRKAGSGWIRASSVPGALPQARLGAASINNSGGRRRRSGDGRRGLGRKMFNHSGHLRSATLGLRCNAARPRGRRQLLWLPSPPGILHRAGAATWAPKSPRGAWVRGSIPRCGSSASLFPAQVLYFQLSLCISTPACLQASPVRSISFFQPAAVAQGSRGARPALLLLMEPLTCGRRTPWEAFADLQQQAER